MGPNPLTLCEIVEHYTDHQWQVIPERLVILLYQHLISKQLRNITPEAMKAQIRRKVKLLLAFERTHSVKVVIESAPIGEQLGYLYLCTVEQFTLQELDELAWSLLGSPVFAASKTQKFNELKSALSQKLYLDNLDSGYSR